MDYLVEVKVLMRVRAGSEDEALVAAAGRIEDDHQDDDIEEYGLEVWSVRPTVLAEVKEWVK